MSEKVFVPRSIYGGLVSQAMFWFPYLNIQPTTTLFLFSFFFLINVSWYRPIVNWFTGDWRWSCRKDYGSIPITAIEKSCNHLMSAPELDSTFEKSWYHICGSLMFNLK
jgi:hypothetical protein